MKCEACGGDGLIEVGAYRGDEDDPNTRECRLCGEVVTQNVWVPSLAQVGVSAKRAGEALKRMGQAGMILKESTSGSRRTATVVSDTQNWTAHEKSCHCPPCTQFWAKRTAAEWNERLRQENNLKQRQSEADAAMNEFLREKFKD